ncbi:hypothetical protein ACLDYA_18275 [Acinetobacter baumannii]|uniref:hypothetical protein n=1 Tax=Acinetobacter TaxID=469 RepID=UPI002A755A95|nr:hypothetical protein [Acinetobacter pittii]WPP87452.1 hypothetical protein SOI77_13870 [Acinetobacter pittii]
MDNNLLDYCNEIVTTQTSFPDLQYRNVIGRAYYFTFHEAKFHLEDRLKWSETSFKGGVHARLYSRLHGYDSNTNDQVKLNAELVYTKINALKKLRTRADYKMEIKITGELANFSIEEAKRISELFEQV